MSANPSQRQAPFSLSLLVSLTSTFTRRQQQQQRQQVSFSLSSCQAAKFLVYYVSRGSIFLASLLDWQISGDKPAPQDRVREIVQVSVALNVNSLLLQMICFPFPGIPILFLNCTVQTTLNLSPLLSSSLSFSRCIILSLDHHFTLTSFFAS